MSDDVDDGGAVGVDDLKADRRSLGGDLDVAGGESVFRGHAPGADLDIVHKPSHHQFGGIGRGMDICAYLLCER